MKLTNYCNFQYGTVQELQGALGKSYLMLTFRKSVDATQKDILSKQMIWARYHVPISNETNSKRHRRQTDGVAVVSRGQLPPWIKMRNLRHVKRCPDICNTGPFPLKTTFTFTTSSFYVFVHSFSTIRGRLRLSFQGLFCMFSTAYLCNYVRANHDILG